MQDSNNDSTCSNRNKQTMREGYQPIVQETHDNDSDNDVDNGDRQESGGSYDFTDALTRIASNNSILDDDIDVDNIDIQSNRNQKGEEGLLSTNTASVSNSPFEDEFNFDRQQ
jgi:hypothetical protein